MPKSKIYIAGLTGLIIFGGICVINKFHKKQLKEKHAKKQEARDKKINEEKEKT